jgi:spectinomycin phosphotransferase
VPPALGAQIPRESYSPEWRDLVRGFQAQIEETTFPEPVAAEFAAFVHARRDEISHIVARAEMLAATLRAQSPAHVLCHADIHGGNVLIDGDGMLWIVDWDTLTFAPKEHDLMFVGGGIFGVWNDVQEEAWFYRGYGETAIDPVALAYYRYERIVQDVAAYCEQLLLTDEGGADRAQALHYFRGQFEPNDVVEAAYHADALLDEGT